MSTTRNPLRKFERDSDHADRVHPRRIAQRPSVADADPFPDRPQPPDVRDLNTTLRLTAIAPAVLWRDWHW